MSSSAHSSLIVFIDGRKRVESVFKEWVMNLVSPSCRSLTLGDGSRWEESSQSDPDILLSLMIHESTSYRTRRPKCTAQHSCRTRAPGSSPGPAVRWSRSGSSSSAADEEACVRLQDCCSSSVCRLLPHGAHLDCRSLRSKFIRLLTVAQKLPACPASLPCLCSRIRASVAGKAAVQSHQRRS